MKGPFDINLEFGGRKLITKRIVLRFPQSLAGRPVVYKLARDYDLEFNILKADVTPDTGGSLVLEIRGKKGDYERGIKYITDAGVHVKSLSQDILRDDELCSHCGVCVSLCPNGAFVVDSVTRKVNFRDENCIVCGLCVKVCPFHAMTMNF